MEAVLFLCCVYIVLGVFLRWSLVTSWKRLYWKSIVLHWLFKIGPDDIYNTGVVIFTVPLSAPLYKQ